MHSFWEPSCAAEFAVNTAEPWTAETNTFITYESPRSIALKVDFVKERGLGGLMAWELSLDLQANEELSLLGLINKRLVENTMDKDMGENSIEYSSSRFENVNNVVQPSSRYWRKRHLQDWEGRERNRGRMKNWMHSWNYYQSSLNSKFQVNQP